MRLDRPSVQDVPLEFGHYLAGLVDGEGTFLISNRARHVTLDEPAFAVKLRDDDAALLQFIRLSLGRGTFVWGRKLGNTNGSLRWSVSQLGECAFIASLFDRFPLRSKKRRDHALWSEWVRARVSGLPAKNPRLQTLALQLRAVKGYNQ